MRPAHRAAHVPLPTPHGQAWCQWGRHVGSPGEVLQAYCQWVDVYKALIGRGRGAGAKNAISLSVPVPTLSQALCSMLKTAGNMTSRSQELMIS